MVKDIMESLNVRMVNGPEEETTIQSMLPEATMETSGMTMVKVMAEAPGMTMEKEMTNINKTLLCKEAIS
jgi:hypothetical protein